MDVVYTCRRGENEELRYSIRSIIANFATVENIWVVGGKPDWYSGNFIPTRPLADPFETVRNNLRIALGDPRISDQFVFMNDDFFINKTISDVPNFHAGTLEKKSQDHTNAFGYNHYASSLMETDAILKQRGIKVPRNFETHIPMVFEKEKLSKTVGLPYSIRSYYGNIYEIESTDISNDVKIYMNDGLPFSSSIDNGTPFFSTEDGSFKVVSEYLESKFPDPSPFE